MEICSVASLRCVLEPGMNRMIPEPVGMCWPNIQGGQSKGKPSIPNQCQVGLGSGYSRFGFRLSETVRAEAVSHPQHSRKQSEHTPAEIANLMLVRAESDTLRNGQRRNLERDTKFPVIGTGIGGSAAPSQELATLKADNADSWHVSENLCDGRSVAKKPWKRARRLEEVGMDALSNSKVCTGPNSSPATSSRARGQSPRQVWEFRVQGLRVHVHNQPEVIDGVNRSIKSDAQSTGLKSKEAALRTSRTQEGALDSCRQSSGQRSEALGGWDSELAPSNRAMWRLAPIGPQGERAGLGEAQLGLCPEASFIPRGSNQNGSGAARVDLAEDRRVSASQRNKEGDPQDSQSPLLARGQPLEAGSRTGSLTAGQRSHPNLAGDSASSLHKGRLTAVREGGCTAGALGSSEGGERDAGEGRERGRPTTRSVPRTTGRGGGAASSSRKNCSPVKQEGAVHEILQSVAQRITKRELAGLPLVGEVKAAGLRLDGRVLNALVGGLGRMGHWRGALQAVEAFAAEGVEANEFVYTTLISILGKCGQLEEAKAAYGRMQAAGISPSVATGNALIGACMRGRDWKTALQLCGRLEAAGVPPTHATYSGVIAACAAAGRWQAALDLGARMEAQQLSLTAKNYTDLIIACARGRRPMVALQILDHMERAEGSGSCTADVAVYSAAMSACASMGQWEGAMRTLARMERRALVPNVVTWSALLSACANGGQPQVAHEAFQKMRAKGCEPNVVTWTALVSAHAKVGDWRTAEAVVGEMRREGVGLNQVTWGALMGAYAAAGKWQKAVAALDTMAAEGCPPHELIWNAAIDACGKGGRWRLQTELLQRMEASGRQPTVVTYSCLIKGFGDAGQSLSARAAFDQMVARGIRPNSVACSSVIRAYARSRQFGQALAFFEKMPALGVVPDKFTYTALLWACGFCGQWQRAGGIFEQMKRQGCAPDSVTYTTLINTYETHGEWDRAMAVFQNMQP